MSNLPEQNSDPPANSPSDERKGWDFRLTRWWIILLASIALLSLGIITWPLVVKRGLPAHTVSAASTQTSPAIQESQSPSATSALPTPTSSPSATVEIATPAGKAINMAEQSLIVLSTHPPHVRSMGRYHTCHKPRRQADCLCIQSKWVLEPLPGGAFQRRDKPINR
jgi:hypothetical protein